MATWTRRPSVLSLENYKDAKLSRESFLEHYQEDNRLAAASASPGSQASAVPPRSSRFRTLQWNLNGWASDNGTLNSLTYSKQITATILQADADCIILNEYHWNDSSRAHEELEKKLLGLGYTTQMCGTVFCPTFLATRWHSSHKAELILSKERSAMVMRLMDDQGEFVTVIGTHLDHRDGQLRHKEMQKLLQDLFCQQRHGNPQEEQGADFADDDIIDIGADTRIILAGDLNQQRQIDYPHEEWESAIAPSMVRRQVCLDDGVDTLLQKEGFLCAWENGSPTTNWTTQHPPSTHWSGTVVDYSYGRNVAVNAVFISPVGWSDHRMTVVDWTW